MPSVPNRWRAAPAPFVAAADLCFPEGVFVVVDIVD
jgi:hypothetical protein